MNINNVLNLLNINNNHTINFNGLEFISDKINKGASIEIYGDENTSKTLFAKNLIKNNPNKIFLYMDTYCHAQIQEDNAILLMSNKIQDLLNLLNNQDSREIDSVIIDTISYLDFGEERANKERYLEYNKAIKELIDLCFKRKIVLIMLNTLNGKGNAYCSTYQTKYLINTIIKFEHHESRDHLEIINVTLEKNKMGNRKSELIYLKRDY